MLMRLGPRYRGQRHTVIANDLCEQLRLTQGCDKVKAVVLRVDSPGRQRHQGMINTLSIWLSSLCIALCFVEASLTSHAQDMLLSVHA